MARSKSVWGIDIGQCALKALKCKLDDDGETIIAEAFDYIEYPKILSQPEANAAELVKEALDQFLSRNDVKRDKVAISVSGQNGLARFFKPPPVQAKQIPDIVKYEAKQQIPFPLEDVIWDFQVMSGGEIIDGFALDAEVGLFAMKRDQVERALEPFRNADVALSIVQLSPLCIYNFITHDMLDMESMEDEYDPDDPPESMVILSMGTDTTDLVITNGFRVWQRSIPLGGNHFTRQLTKELKLTFAKAEHLKRNARQAEDPKTVFQAMRPVFGDLVAELQRTIGYFQGNERKEKIGKLVMIGNPIKLPGLQQYLTKNLDYEVIEFESFANVSGQEVLSAPSFKDNMQAFGVAYGLCLQGLGEGRLNTNLLPQGILFDRMIREKRPWAVAALGALLLSFSFNYSFIFKNWSQTQDDYSVNNTDWGSTFNELAQVKTKSDGYQSQDAAQESHLEYLNEIGEVVAGNNDRRLLVPELLKALNSSLPPQVGILDPEKRPFETREELYIEHVEMEFFPSLATWYTADIKRLFLEGERREPGAAAPAATGPGPAIDPATDPATGAPASTPNPATTPTVGLLQPGGAGKGLEAAITEEGALADGAAANTAPAKPKIDENGPQGEGWVLELKGYHYFNADMKRQGAVHVYNTLIKKLKTGGIPLPTPSGKPEFFTFEELGIQYPILVVSTPIDGNHKLRNPAFDSLGAGGARGAGGLQESGLSGTAIGRPAAGRNLETASTVPLIPEYFKAPKYSFTVQFCWQENRLTERLLEQQKKLQELNAANNAATIPGDNGFPGGNGLPGENASASEDDEE